MTLNPLKQSGTVSPPLTNMFTDTNEMWCKNTSLGNSQVFPTAQVRGRANQAQKMSVCDSIFLTHWMSHQKGKRVSSCIKCWDLNFLQLIMRAVSLQLNLRNTTFHVMFNQRSFIKNKQTNKRTCGCNKCMGFGQRHTYIQLVQS